MQRIILATLSMIMATAAVAEPKTAEAGPKPIPRAQFIASMDGEFHKIDADKDGLLTPAEIEQFQNAKALADAQSRNKEWFVRLDTNRNGSLSAAEFAKMVVAPPASNAQGVLAKMDSNRDGRLTQAEYRAATVANFDRLDADRDGIVTPAEMKAGGIQPAGGKSN